jgi:hypothetical protein
MEICDNLRNELDNDGSIALSHWLKLAVASENLEWAATISEQTHCDAWHAHVSDTLTEASR